MTDFTAVNTEVQKLIDSAVSVVQAQFDAYKASHPDTSPPSTFVWPDATNTGVQSGITLSAYSGPSTITVDGTVISNKTFSSLTIAAKNVLIKNCKTVTSNRVPIYVTGSNCTIQNCTIAGSGTSSNGYGIDGSECTGLKVLSCNISGLENGMILGTNAVAKGNFIHDLKGAGSDPHYDGIVIGGDSVGQTNILIEDNTIIGRDNSCIWITNDFGSISYVTINHNKCLGQIVPGAINGTLPVFTVYADGRKPNGTVSNLTYTNNIIQKGYYGWVEFENIINLTFTNNVKYEDGTILNF